MTGLAAVDIDRDESACQATTSTDLKAQLGWLAAENQRLSAELRLRDAALDAISTGILVIDMQRQDRPIVFANRAVAARSGYSLSELIGRPLVEFTCCSADGDRLAAICAAMTEGRELRIELPAERKDGSYYWAGMTLTPVRDAKGSVTHYVSVSADITARRAEELRSRRASERLTAIVESALEGVIAIDGAMRIDLFNRAAERIFGYRSADLLGRSFELLIPERFRAQCREHVNRFVAGEPVTQWMDESGQLIGLRANGEEFPFEASISRVSIGADPVVIVMLRDVSEQLQAEKERLMLETQLRLAQKLEAVGSLAAGVAHEINTPIQYVGDSVHFLEGACSDLSKLLADYRQAIADLMAGARPADVQERLAAAEHSADVEFITAEMPKAFARTLEGIERVSKIVRAMKEFSHPDQNEQNPADINHALESTLIVARNEYKYCAEVETDFAELPPVVCNISELNQVFLNLLVNAAHAIVDACREAGQGRIRIATRVAGDAVEIEFKDNGCGIPPHIIDKIFDPFFTTKEVGRGTGQGLAITRSIIVDKHKGSVAVDSVVGVGTQFVLRLPIAGRPMVEAV